MKHEEYMALAIQLAKKGMGKVNPNPLVGAVIVKEDRVIGQGYHREFGGPHGEINALTSCAESPKGGRLYVTLEPCCHYGKTPPCTETIMKAGIKEVVVGCLDPNSKVAGKGIRQLEEAGIVVITGVLEEECKNLNYIFFHYITKKTPYVIMKYAMTLDGKIATCQGESKWITGEKARKKVQETRNECMGIMVGVGTILEDNPMLNCRLHEGRNPIRIICDTHLRTPLKSKIIATAKTITTIIATGTTNKDRQQNYLEQGCHILEIPIKQGEIDLSILLEKLGGMGIDSILLEGGSTLNESALKERIVQKIQGYVAPKLLGGEKAKTPLGGEGVAKMENCYLVEHIQISTIGEDILIEGEVRYPCLQES